LYKLIVLQRQGGVKAMLIEFQAQTTSVWPAKNRCATFEDRTWDL